MNNIDRIYKKISESYNINKYFEFYLLKERNILINLTQYLIDNNLNKEHKFTESEIRQYILIKEPDYDHYLNTIFKCKNNEYIILDHVYDKLNNYINNYNQNKDNTNEEDFIKEFDKYMQTSCEKYDLTKLIKYAIKLHWKYLPMFIYYKYSKDYTNYIPENNLEEWYSKYTNLQILYKCIKNKYCFSYINHNNYIDFNTIRDKGTLSKPIPIEIYNKNLYEKEKHILVRTSYGWELDGIFAFKNGDTSIYDMCEQTKIFYSKEAMRRALETLWDKAEQGEIDYDELNKKLDELFNWINNVQKEILQKQPNWFIY